MPQTIKQKIATEMQKHRIIKISLKDKLMYYIYNQIGLLFCCGICWSNKKKITSLIDEAQDRLDKELNIVKMIQNLRNMKIMLKCSMNQDIWQKVAHH